MNSLHLASSPFEERHTGESIANGLKVVLERHEVSGEDVEGRVMGISRAFHAWPTL